MARCIGFTMKDVAAAYEHMEFELVEAYGDFAYGHYLHTWDDGGRSLFRCKNCGGYVPSIMAFLTMTAITETTFRLIRLRRRMS